MNKILVQGLGKIEKDKVGWGYAKKGRPSGVKSQISRAIGDIIRDKKPKKIKIGKSGDFNRRRSGKDYAEYNLMEILYSSSSQKYVEYLESYYIEFINKNYPQLTTNKKGGSAGVLSEKTKHYVVYLVIE
jgi:hypothetical protein